MSGWRKKQIQELTMTKDEMIDWMMNKGLSTGHGESTKDLLDELEWQIAEREREACAKICDEFYKGNPNINYSNTIAICIRGRTREK
jgi:hypothetical protein